MAPVRQERDAPAHIDWRGKTGFTGLTRLQKRGAKVKGEKVKSRRSANSQPFNLRTFHLPTSSRHHRESEIAGWLYVGHVNCPLWSVLVFLRMCEHSKDQDCSSPSRHRSKVAVISTSLFRQLRCSCSCLTGVTGSGAFPKILKTRRKDRFHRINWIQKTSRMPSFLNPVKSR
jgi:hypothetical protein